METRDVSLCMPSQLEESSNKEHEKLQKESSKLAREAYFEYCIKSEKP